MMDTLYMCIYNYAVRFQIRIVWFTGVTCAEAPYIAFDLDAFIRIVVFFIFSFAPDGNDIPSISDGDNAPLNKFRK